MTSLADTRRTIKPNLLFRYRPSHSWCRHGLVRTFMRGDSLTAADTYWLDPNYGGFSLDDLNTLEFVGDLDEFRKSSREECDRYLDADVIHIPLGASSEQWWVRQSAEPDRQRTIDQLTWQIADKESTIRSATYALEELKKKLEQIG